MLRLAVLAVVTILSSGIAHIAARPARNESADAVRIVVALRDGAVAPDRLPPDLSRKLGYRPVARLETLMNPDGGCSTPGGVGPDSFGDACRTHDLGYDMLRYAEVSGARLGPWARFELDRRLYLDLVDTCEHATCRTLAAAYLTAVTANSVRQGYMTPTAEPALPWIGLTLALIVVAVIWSALVDGSDRQTTGPSPRRGPDGPGPWIGDTGRGLPLADSVGGHYFTDDDHSVLQADIHMSMPGGLPTEDRTALATTDPGRSQVSRLRSGGRRSGRIRCVLCP